jgi:hypothetical protein
MYVHSILKRNKLTSCFVFCFGDYFTKSRKTRNSVIVGNDNCSIHIYRLIGGKFLPKKLIIHLSKFRVLSKKSKFVESADLLY